MSQGGYVFLEIIYLPWKKLAGSQGVTRVYKVNTGRQFCYKTRQIFIFLLKHKQSPTYVLAGGPQYAILLIWCPFLIKRVVY